MTGVQVRWDSPVAAVGGKHYKKIVKATGVETVGDLLGIFPRRYVRKGALSELEDLQEGDLISFVGEVVSSVQKPYQDRRTHRTAYRLEVHVQGRGRQPRADLLRPRQAHRRLAHQGARPWPRGHVQRAAEVVQQPLAADQPRLQDVRRRRRGRLRLDAGPHPDLLLGGRGEHLAARGDDRDRPRPRRGHPGPAAADGPRGRGPHRGRPGAALDPPARQLGTEGLGREAAQVRRGLRRADRARPSPSRDRGDRRQPPTRRSGRHPRPVRRTAPVRPDRRPAQRGGGDRRRARPGPPDAPAAAGGGRLGQDGRRAARDAPGGRLGRPGGTARPDRGARPAAPALDHGDARRPGPGRSPRGRRGRHPRGAADRLAQRGLPATGAR